MGRKDVSNAAPIDQYRKKLGEQEFKGRSKRNTLATKEKAQARRSSHGVQSLVTIVGGLFILLLLIYVIVYFLLGNY